MSSLASLLPSAPKGWQPWTVGVSRRIVTSPSHPLAVSHFDLLMLETSTTTLIFLFVKLVALKGVLHDGGEVASTRAQTQAWLLRALRKSWRTMRAGSWRCEWYTWRCEWYTCLLAHMVLRREILNEIQEVEILTRFFSCKFLGH